LVINDGHRAVGAIGALNLDVLSVSIDCAGGLAAARVFGDFGAVGLVRTLDAGGVVGHGHVLVFVDRQFDTVWLPKVLFVTPDVAVFFIDLTVEICVFNGVSVFVVIDDRIAPVRRFNQFAFVG